MSTIETARRYESDGYLLIPSLIGDELRRHLVGYADLLYATDGFQPDDQVPGSLRAYGAIGFDALLEPVGQQIAAATGLDLLPTYSFARRYLRGQELYPHKDRVECEHSVTLHLAGSDDGDPWPIWLRSNDGEPVAVDLGPGDGVVYRGDQMVHWRDPLDASWYLQVFLHYVDAAGAYADRGLDGRDALGTRPGGPTTWPR